VEGAPRLMIIFSMGGLMLRRHGHANRLRCRPALVAVGAPEIDVTLDPYPDRTGQGVVAGGKVRVVADGVDVASRDLSPSPAPGRWDDLDLLEYAACSLWSWVSAGPLTRQEEGDLVHELSDHCDFGGVVVATRRRTRNRHGVPVAWADLVAAHVIPTQLPAS